DRPALHRGPLPPARARAHHRGVPRRRAARPGAGGGASGRAGALSRARRSGQVRAPPSRLGRVQGCDRGGARVRERHLAGTGQRRGAGWCAGGGAGMKFTGYELGDPWFLLLLLLVPVLVSVTRLVHTRASARLPDTRIAAKLPGTWRTFGLKLLPWARALALALIVVGLARPLKGLSQSQVFSEGVDIAL